MSAGEPGPGRASAARQLGLMVFDIGAPLALYYVLRAAGLPPLTALALSAVPPAIGAAWQLAARRHADPVALLVLGTVALSLILAVVVHSPRFLLARDGLITALWGIWFLATAVPGRGRGAAGRAGGRPVPPPGRVPVRPAAAGRPPDLRARVLG